MNTPDYPTFEAAESACRDQGLTPLRHDEEFTVLDREYVGEVLSAEVVAGTLGAPVFFARVTADRDPEDDRRHPGANYLSLSESEQEEIDR